MIERDWYGCYSDGWQNEITPESFAHPAKFARGLIRQIYHHALEQGYFKSGDLVLDPFGGVALGARDAIQLGLNWFGIELEEKFVKLGNENLDLWRFRLRGQDGQNGLPELGQAVLLQGDSRYLVQVLAGGVVSSPPFSQPGEQPCASQSQAIKDYHAFTRGDGTKYDKQMADPANLANLPEGNHERTINLLASPPYAETVTNRNDSTIEGDKKHRIICGRDPESPGALPMREYGRTPGQLGAMRVVSSPVYPDARGGSPSQGENILTRYGKSEGQLGNMRVVSSPPYAESLASDDPDKRGGLFKDPKRHDDKTLTAEYGESEGQLGAMKVVSSPPWDNGAPPIPLERIRETSSPKDHGGPGPQYQPMPIPDDFWTAAQTIMQQTYSVLASGATAIWVLKAFVRDKQIVDFPDQWRQLGEACGFKTIEWIRAWLVEDRGAQYTLDGELEHKTVERKSFFRRLAENKGSPRIDFEIVLIQQKL